MSVLDRYVAYGRAVACRRLYRLQGKKQETVTSAGPGDIVAIARLENVQTLDTLTTGGIKTVMPASTLPEPVFAVAIAPRDRLDEAKLSQMLARLIDEDPALRLMRAEFTNELELCGCGEVHFAVAAERLRANTTSPSKRVRRRFRIARRSRQRHRAHSRYKHQTGGHGQFGEVRLRIEPRDRGNGVTFEEKIVGGVVPRQFFPAVEKGVREALMRGPTGFPVTDLHVTLYDGSFHAVDSSEAVVQDGGVDGDSRRASEMRRPVSRTHLRDRSAGARSRSPRRPFRSSPGSAASVQSFGPAENSGLYASRRTFPKPSSRTTSPSCAPRPKA